MVTTEIPTAESKKRLQSTAAGSRVGTAEEEGEGEEGRLTHRKTLLQVEDAPYHPGRACR